MTESKYSVVVGAQGFIGENLVHALLKAGKRVRRFDRRHPPNDSALAAQDERLQTLVGNFLEPSDIKAALSGCDICYHLISTTNPRSSNESPIFDVQTNLIGTIQLLDAAVEAGVKKIVFVSSGGTVYGSPLQVPIPESHTTNPTCSYGITKLSIEKYLCLYQQLYGLDYSILRVANPYGKGQQFDRGQGAVAVFLQKALNNDVIEIWGDGSIVRDYIHVDESLGGEFFERANACI